MFSRSTSAGTVLLYFVQVTVLIKRLAVQGLVKAIGGEKLPRWLHNTLAPNHFTILTYHGVTREALELEHPCFLTESRFREQIAYLARQCQLLRLEDAVALAARAPIDRPTVVLTFDDGFQNNYDIVFPILKEFGVPATVFLTTGYIGTADTLWYCRVHDALTRTSLSSLDWRGHSVPLGSERERVQASRFLSKKLKRYPHPELSPEVERILRALGVDPQAEVPEDSPFRMLDEAAIDVMGSSGLIDFGAHTDSHAILSRVASRVKRREIERSLDKVAEWTGRKCTLFAYPNGQSEDYDDGTLAILRNRDVNIAVTGVPGGNTATTPTLELRRYAVGPNADLKMFRLQVHHVLPYVRSRVHEVLTR